ncbi:MAG: helix-turn-helix domain-containing protein [Oscillospiraceae bacterium]
MKLNSLFLKYCLRYLTAFLVILLCCVLLAVVAYNTIERYVVEENRLHLQSSSNEIHQNISKLELASQMIRKDSYFQQLYQINGEIPPAEYMNIKYANQQFIYLGHVYGFSPYGFALFRDNDFMLSSRQCTVNFSDYYGKLMQVEAKGIDSVESFRETLFGMTGESLSFWPVNSIRYYQEGIETSIDSAILCVVNEQSSYGAVDSPYTLVFVLDPVELSKRLLTQSNLEEGHIRILDTRADVVLFEDLPPDGTIGSDDYHILKQDIPELGWEITVGIPSSVIARQFHDIRSVLFMYVYIGLALVLLLTLLFSYRQYRGIRKIFVRIPDMDQLGRKTDEFEVISRHLTVAAESHKVFEKQIELLGKQNRAILLENLLVRGVHTQEEIDAVKQCFQQELRYFCVVVARMETAGREEVHIAALSMVEFLRENIATSFYHVHSGLNDELFLIMLDPEAQSNVENIRALFDTVALMLTDDMDIVLNTGISAIGEGVANVNTCYHQAKQVMLAYFRENQNTVNAYHIGLNAEREMLLDLKFADKLYNILLAGETVPVANIFEKLRAHYHRQPLLYEANKAVIFYTIYNAVFEAYRHTQANALKDYTMFEYDENISFLDMLNAMQKGAEEFCAQVNSGKKWRNSELKQRIMDYMEENYTDAGLTAATICHAVGTSEKYLFRLVKEHTGKTVAEYLEHLRLEEAKRLLLTTDLSNEKIAAMAGFGALNTFYRVFGKNAGLSPGAYRNSHRPVS